MNKNELFVYLELLIKLEANDYNCKREIAETIEAIRKQFGFIK